MLVGGSTAWFVDQKAAISAHTPLALLILALVTGGFLFLMTGSLVLPFVALAMNLLTVAVGAGLLVLIFQDGHLSSLAGFTPIGGLEESNLVLLFVVAFALSTDYGVFVFARIKEFHDSGLPMPGDTPLGANPRIGSNRDAVAHGRSAPGRPVTAAACCSASRLAPRHLRTSSSSSSASPRPCRRDRRHPFNRALLVPAIMGCLASHRGSEPCAACTPGALACGGDLGGSRRRKRGRLLPGRVPGVQDLNGRRRSGGADVWRSRRVTRHARTG